SGYFFDWDDMVLECLEQPDGSVEFTVTKKDKDNYCAIYDSDDKLVATVPPSKTGIKGVFKNGLKADYGMNARAHRLISADDVRKVLVLDYSHPVANVVEPYANQVFSSYVAPRHNGLCNVLYV